MINLVRPDLCGAADGTAGDESGEVESVVTSSCVDEG
jgi:hypothetical protein